MNWFFRRKLSAQEKRSERGSAMLEYLLLASLLCVVAIPAITVLGLSAAETFDKVQIAGGGSASTMRDDCNQGSASDGCFGG